MAVATKNTLAMPVHALAWPGRQGTRATAALVFVGIFVPQVGGLLRPLVTPAIFLLLCTAFMRVDVAALRGYLRRPGLVIAATAWTMLAVPSVFGLVCLATGVQARAPDLFLGLMLQAAAPPMMAAPAFAALMGLDATLVLITLVTGTALVPLTAPLFAYAFVGPVLTLSPLALGLRLFAILAGSLLAAAAIRRIVGIAAIERHKEPIDGINILLMLVFVTAVMSTLVASFLADPVKIIGLVLLAFALFFALLGLTMLIFRRLGHKHALAIGLAVAQRNMGLMLAATEGVLPGATWLYFALCQFPIYVSPQLLRPLARSKTT